ncbi:hypothetical protein B0T22DRAFT_144498 [Podospora appendiculata]|uniref:Uncharacterized protein n=1 Tax=Podospora appendiculata TaxID=314037 RepID=A0AAE0X8Q8_9PEZI|nr:hypothetical protein B0T22DRAFT_144498 [Podospora appendiculata]
MSSASKDTDSTLCESGNHDMSKTACLVSACALTPPPSQPTKTQAAMNTCASIPVPTHQDNERDVEIVQPALFEKPLSGILLPTASEGGDYRDQLMMIPPEAEPAEPAEPAEAEPARADRAKAEPAEAEPAEAEPAERVSTPQPVSLRPAAPSPRVSSHENEQSARPHRDYPQVHAREFSRLSVPDPPVPGGYFMSHPAFPPPDMSEENRKLEEYLYCKSPAPALSGMYIGRIDELLNIYTENCREYGKIVGKEKEYQKNHLVVRSDKAEEIKAIEKESLFLDMAIKKRKARAVTIHGQIHCKMERKRRLLAEEADAIIRYQNRLMDLEDQKKLLTEEIGVANGKIRQSQVQEWKYYERVYLEECDTAAKAELDAASERKQRAEQEEQSDLVKMASVLGIRPKPQGPFSTKQDQLPSHASPNLHGQSPNDLVRPPSLTDHSQFSKPNSDLVGFAVPSWFRIFLSNSSMTLSAMGDKGKFDELISRLEFLTKAVNQGDATSSVKAPFTKNWHEPHKDWPFPGWQQRGGWWTCRLGPGASPAEKACKLCRSKRTTVEEESGETLAEQYKKLMADINKAMDLAIEPQKKALKARFQAERDEADRSKVGWRRVVPLIGENIASYWARK